VRAGEVRILRVEPGKSDEYRLESVLMGQQSLGLCILAMSTWSNSAASPAAMPGARSTASHSRDSGTESLDTAPAQYYEGRFLIPAMARSLTRCNGASTVKLSKQGLQSWEEETAPYPEASAATTAISHRLARRREAGTGTRSEI